MKTQTKEVTDVTVLVLGGTGRTGGMIVRQLLERGVRVRAVVRSAQRLPDGVAEDARLEVVQADLLALDDEEFARLVDGCDAVVSCLGHTISAQGVFGKPRDLVTQAARRVCRAAATLQPEQPVRFVLMSSVAVNRPGRADARRGSFERALLWLQRGLVPPGRDNQRAADFLLETMGQHGGHVEWTAVRPDTLREGDISPYVVHEALVDGLFRPGETARANVADFMCELVTDDAVWDRWRGRLPVIVNTAPA
jgi:nucleoside-diphosphate-sugar epimerase